MEVFPFFSFIPSSFELARFLTWVTVVLSYSCFGLSQPPEHDLLNRAVWAGMTYGHTQHRMSNVT